MRIFISYRRSDTRHLAGRIADRLRSDNEIDEVFLDVDGIGPGDDFESKIKTAIAESTVCLVLIGQNWMGRRDGEDRDDTGKDPRIFDEHDFIRLETRVALASGRRVIPVLVEDIKMPQAVDLPEDLQKLTRLNAVTIGHLHFNRDVESLIEALLGRVVDPNTAPGPAQRSLLGQLFFGLAGVLIAAIALVGVAIVHNSITGGRALDETFGGSGQVWLLICGVLALGALGPTMLGRIRKKR